MRRRSTPARSAGRTTSVTSTWPGRIRQELRPPSNARSVCDPTMWRRWCGWVTCTSIEGRPELAEPLFTRALSIQPRTVAALFGLGQVALARREYSRAVAQFEQVLATDPRASIAHYPLALAYRGLGDTARAEAHLRQQGSVEVGPPDPLMVELRGLLQGAVAEENRGIRALDEWRLQDRSGALPQGRRARTRQPVCQTQAGDGIVIDRRHARRVRAIPGNSAAIARLLTIPLQPRGTARGERTTSGGNRALLDRYSIRAQLC